MPRSRTSPTAILHGKENEMRGIGEIATRWQQENAEAIEDYNRRIKSAGTFGDGLRLF